MEKNINAKIHEYTLALKADVRKNAMTIFKSYNISDEDMLLFVNTCYDYRSLVLHSDDIKARTRTKNTVPVSNRCIAKCADKIQCTRKQKAAEKFCGTHMKCCPHGTIDIDDDVTKIKLCVFVVNIRGINYYIDTHNNVYNTADILSDKVNPEILCKSVIDADGNRTIPFLNVY